MDTGRAIRHLRLKRLPEISQFEFSESLSITQGYLSRIETGKVMASHGLIKQVADLMDIPEIIIYLYSIDIEDIPKENRLLFIIIEDIIKNVLEDI